MKEVPSRDQEDAIVEIPVAIAREDVLHFLGYPEGQLPAERVACLVDEMIEEARGIVGANGSFVRHPVGEARHVGLEPIEASALFVGLVTIGGVLESRVTRLVEQGEATRALLLDAAGSAAVEEAADRLGAVIAGTGDHVDTRLPAEHVSCRISPGYGTWPLTAQAELFGVLPHERVGVSLLPTMLMTPRKSISFAMWLGADRRPVSGLSGCARCSLVECRYRSAKKEGNP